MRNFLLLASAASIAFSASAENLVDVESDAFGEAVRAYLLKNPEVIFEAVDIYNAKQEALAEQSAQDSLTQVMPALLDESTAIVLGNPDAEIAVVEFIDYNCGYCRKAHEAVNHILSEHDDVKVILRHFPILSQGSLEASQVAMSIQSQFGNEDAIKFHNAAYAHQGQLGKDSALQIAAEIGIDVTKLGTAFEDKAIFEQVAVVRDAATQLKIEGTPGFIIGDEIIRGYIPEDQLATIIDSIRDKS